MANMFNFNFKSKEEKGKQLLISVGKQGFIAGLEAGIGMVRIAAARETKVDLYHLADIMQQALDEFTAGDI